MGIFKKLKSKICEECWHMSMRTGKCIIYNKQFKCDYHKAIDEAEAAAKAAIKSIRSNRPIATERLYELAAENTLNEVEKKLFG